MVVVVFVFEVGVGVVMMLFAVDSNILVHLMWHMGASESDAEEPDLADVLDHFMIRLDNLREYVFRKGPDWGVDPSQARFIAVFDNPRPCFRRYLVDGYKANRESNPSVHEVLRDAVKAVESSDEWTGVVAHEGFEADDVLASLAAQYEGRVLLHSSDKDMNQCLVDGRVGIIKRSGVEQEVNSYGIPVASELTCLHYSERKLMRDFALVPAQWVDYQCLVGDTADNVAGALGIGDKTARKILREGKPESVDPEEIGLNVRQRENWPEFIDRLGMLREVFALRTNLEICEGVL